MTADKLDSDPWLLNADNGTIDLRTGKLQRHNHTDNLTKRAPVKFSLDAGAPQFAAFLQRIFDGNDSLILYAQRLFGMAASGTATEQILPILWGEGANGKSTLLGIIQFVMGDYAGTAPDSLLTLTTRKSTRA